MSIIRYIEERKYSKGRPLYVYLNSSTKSDVELSGLDCGNGVRCSDLIEVVCRSLEEVRWDAEKVLEVKKGLQERFYLNNWKNPEE